MINKFSYISADDRQKDNKFFVILGNKTKKDKIIKKKSLIIEDLSKEIINCYETPKTLIGTNEINTKNFKIFGDNYSIDENSSISSALFLDFADIIIARANELDWFLNEYGLLSQKSDLLKVSAQEVKSLNTSKMLKLDDEMCFAEPLSLWILLQVRVRSLIRLWRFMQVEENKQTDNSYYHLLFEDENYLKLFDIENDQFSETVLSNELYGKFLHKDFKKELDFNLSPKIDIEKYLLSGGISDNISSLGKEQKLSIFSSRYIENQINSFFSNKKFSPQFAFDFNLGNQVIKRKSYGYNQYNSLLQLIFFQLMDAIIKNKKFSRCLECQTWFENIELGKKGKIYCGPNCRAKAYRRRKEIKQINAFADPNSRWSIQNIVLELAEKIEKGNIEEYKKYEEEFNKQFSDKVIQRTVKGIRDNIFDNIFAWSTNETIAEHLDIDNLWLEKVKDRGIFYDNFSDQPEYTMTYVDWDHNFKW